MNHDRRQEHPIERHTRVWRQRPRNRQTPAARHEEPRAARHITEHIETRSSDPIAVQLDREIAEFLAKPKLGDPTYRCKLRGFGTEDAAAWSAP